MRLSLSVYVSVEREEGRSVFSCRPLRGPQVLTRDPLLRVALSKLGNKMRKSIHGWIEAGHSSRISTWLYDTTIQAKTVKLTLVLRDRTLRWKLLLVSLPSFSRYVAFSPSIPSAPFEVEALADLEARATEVYTAWASNILSEGDEALLEGIGQAGDMWIEPLEVEVETLVPEKSKAKNIFAALFGGGKTNGSDELHKVGHCLDDIAARYDQAIGRQDLVDEIDRILQRDDRQGVLIVGPPAVGKTAIIEECVRRRAERFRNRRDHKPQVWWLSPQRLISGMSYLGQWEQRWLAILRESSKRDHILYFDDLVGLYSAGRTRDSSLSAADVLRGFLAEHRIRLLAELTAEQLAVLRRRDRAMADRFHLIHVPALSPEDALPIVIEASHDIEIRTQRYFHPEAVPLILRHQEMFAPDQAFPGKAIEMCKTLSKHSSLLIDQDSVYRLAGAQVGASRLLLRNRLGGEQAIQLALARQLIGQPDAIAALGRTVIRYSQRLQPPDRPLGVMLLLGPTGVGKTEAAKALTRLLYTDESHLVRLDMNELTTPYAAEQLVGSFDQPEGRLTAAVRRQPNCVILLDEIEKAHPDVFDYLLQVLGEGRLTDARGRVADFRSTIIIMTSNLGALEQNASLGFEISPDRQQQIYVKAAKQFFRPEFFNRIDEVVAFRNLDADDMGQIVAIQLNQVLSRDGIKRRNIFVTIDAAAIQQVIQKGFDSKLGARAVRRMLESEIIGPLADCLSAMHVDHPALVKISHQPPQTELNCNVLQLSVAQRIVPNSAVDLEQLLENGRSLYEQLDVRLSELSEELQIIDREVTGQTHGASYYALREQLYRCSQLLKTLRLRLGRQSEPRLELAPQAVSKPRRDLDNVGVRRGLKDWQAQEDLRHAINDKQRAAIQESLPTETIAEQLVESLTTAALMIDSALTPRSWLVGFQPLTSTMPWGASATPGPYADIWRDSGADILADVGSAASALGLWINCLKQQWQYDVADSRIGRSYWLVSGVSLIGILRPLLGTYQIDSSSGASHLQVLRAIAVDPRATSEEMVALTDTDLLIGANGLLRRPAEQPFPTEVIRGAIGESIVDFVSGAKVELYSNGWQYSERVLALTLQWWMDCLPVVGDLLRSE